ncbi:DUF917 domain-containing protein [Microbacterium sp. 13-71-7]|uniref:DUF917 domain-containing protein n=1 Tax=Microbacterium sp. 13-71-7 TaxID=1970399 RepID=UPI000BCA97F4|nr:DUF917 domain-containing protein [Microbacterium sp. 13-71-7]OZB85015.1 MAG: hypothetical protein B7X32_05140 [Microbacterium sp. 13-71-7]
MPELITHADIDAFARGCAILGTGGGGEVESGRLMALNALDGHGPVPLVSLADLPDDGLVLPLSSIGAPTVGYEMIHGTQEAGRVRDAVEQHFGRACVAVMSSEIGGTNGVGAVSWAAELGLPLVDADGMGRAFPEVQMVSMNVAGLPIENITLADVIGNVTILTPVSWAWAEAISRAVSIAAGSYALMADNVLPAARLRGAVIEGTVTRAIQIGRATENTDDPIAALTETLGARILIRGKVVDVERRIGGGFVRGSIVVDGSGSDTGRMIRIEVQNENLIVLEEGQVLASVPDLISVVDDHSGHAIATELVRYGQRVAVLAWPCAPLWRSDRGIAIAGPRAFGYNIDYVPVEEIAHVHS